MNIHISSQHPAKLILLSFLTPILIGTFLLRLPMSSTGTALQTIDAFFMATSAMCVTGLIVVDTGAHLTTFGQLVILGLIQLGGLGIMTLSLLIFSLFRTRFSLATRLSVPGLTKNFDGRNLLESLLFVVFITFLFELFGSILLFLEFRNHYPFSEAIYQSIFHAISAFCNAGFSLHSTSLSAFKSDYYVLTIIMILIVSGGLGFVVLDEVLDGFRAKVTKTPMKFSLHTKICLWGSGLLILVGTFIFLVFEYQNTLINLPLGEKILNSAFLSVTSRTAGFNTLDTASLTNSSLFLLIVLMFIGGCPGSCAGGIKVTTLAVVIAHVRGQMRGLAMSSAFRRKIPAGIVGRSIGLLATGFILINLSTLALQVTEVGLVSHLQAGGQFMDLFFESASALCTVGLSTGATESLSYFGKLLVSILMLIGRVGPLTMGYLILSRIKAEVKYEYPEEDVVIG